MEKHKISRKSMPLKTKIQLIKEVEGNPNKKKTIIAQKYGIAKSTLSTILKEKEKYEQIYKGGEQNGSRLRCGRGAQHPDIDDALLQWFKKARSEDFPMTGPMLRTKAEELSDCLGIHNWRCSEGWLNRWKKRHGIQFKSASSDQSSTEPPAVESVPLGSLDGQPRDRQTDDAVLQTLEWYEPQDVFIVVSSALFWRLLPSKMHYFKGDKCFRGEKSKERLTVMVCCNMDGCEKMPLSVVGKIKNPKCFRGIKALPVQYKATPKAWLTTKIFLEWLQSFDVKMAKENRKVLLVVGSCPTHDVPALKAVEILFLPDNSNFRLHPCGRGIIDNLKADYRKMKILQMMAHTNAGGTAKDYKFSLVDAVCTLKSAWDRVAPSTIRGCFSKLLSTLGKTGSNTENVSNILGQNKVQEACLSRFFEEWNVSPLQYFTVDNDVTTTGPAQSACCTTRPVQATSSMPSQPWQREELSCDSDDDCGAVRETVSSQTVLGCVQTIQTFCLQSGCTDSLLTSFSPFVQALHKYLACANQQTKITQFFTRSKEMERERTDRGWGTMTSSEHDRGMEVEGMLQELSQIGVEEVNPSGVMDNDSAEHLENIIIKVENAEDDNDDDITY